jgi:hypothetical protein
MGRFSGGHNARQATPDVKPSPRKGRKPLEGEKRQFGDYGGVSERNGKTLFLRTPETLFG